MKNKYDRLIKSIYCEETNEISHDLKSLRRILKKAYFKKNINTIMSINPYLVYTLIDRSRMDIIDLLIEYNLDINIEFNEGYNPLMHSLIKDREIACKLIEYGYDVNKLCECTMFLLKTKTGFKKKPLQVAIINHDYDMCLLLVRYGASTNYLDYFNGLLKMAIQNVEFMRQLINLGLSIHETYLYDLEGEASLLMQKGIDYDCAKLLLEKGLEIDNKRDNFGRNIIEICISENRYDLLDLYIDYIKISMDIDIRYLIDIISNQSVVNKIIKSSITINVNDYNVTPLICYTIIFNNFTLFQYIYTSDSYDHKYDNILVKCALENRQFAFIEYLRNTNVHLKALDLTGCIGKNYTKNEINEYIEEINRNGNFSEKDANIMLNIALSKEDVVFAEVMINHNANVNSNVGQNAVKPANIYNLSSKPDILEYNLELMAPIMIAIYIQNYDCIELLFKNGAKINRRYYLGKINKRECEDFSYYNEYYYFNIIYKLVDWNEQLCYKLDDTYEKIINLLKKYGAIIK